MNAKEFETIVGRKPEHDDLERANCHFAGAIAHLGCGICRHGKPVSECFDCYAIRTQQAK